VTLVTGRPPESHGVWRMTEAWAGGVRPVGRASWRAAPVWARLEAAGVSTGSVCWPAAGPGADWPGVHIDRGFAEATGPIRRDWALPRRCAPPAAREALRERRVHPTDITGEMLAPLVPRYADLDQSRDAGLPRLAVAMAQAASVQAAAAWLMTEHDPDAVFVHHDWLAAATTGFRDDGVGPFGQVVAGAWRFFDGLVGRLAELAGPEAVVVVASPGWADRAGALIAAGPGVDPKAGFEGAEATELAPTLMAALGFDAADSGRRPIPAIAPAAARRPAPNPPPAEPVAPDLDLLREAAAEGFVPAPASGSWRARGLTDLALMILPRDPKAAIAVAEAALEADPRWAQALDVQAMAHTALDDREPLPRLAAALGKLAPARAWGPLAQAAFHVMGDDPGAAAPHLTKAEADRDPGVLTRVAAVWFAAGRPNDAERVLRALLEQNPANAAAEVGLAMAALARLDYRGAEDALMRALRIDPGRRTAYVQLAELYRRTGRAAEAERAEARATR
jgi:hypothetical protein